jgi:peptidoglycan/LPS O-acetylase OafA/YrhL
MKKRIVGADGIRALACLWVLLHHAVIEMGTPAESHGIFRRYGPLGVAVFFVLSGTMLSVPFWKRYFAGQPYPSLGHYTRSRLGRIVPAYYVCLGAMVLLDWDFSGANLVRAGAGFLFVNSLHWRTFFPAERDGALWSIGIEMIFYLLFPLWAVGLFRLRRRVAGGVYLVLSLGALVLFQALVVHVRRDFAADVTPDAREIQRLAAEWLPSHNAVGLFAHFLFGCAAAGVMVRLSEREGARGPRAPAGAWNAYDTASLGILALMAVDLYPPGPLLALANVAHVWFMYFNWPLFPALVAALLVCLHFSGRLGAWVDNRFLRWTAKLSYGIYLWHTPILAELKERLPWLVSDAGRAGRLGYALAGTALAYLVAAISFRYLEKPVMDRVVHGARGAAE